jgi:hypothetical protein
MLKEKSIKDDKKKTTTKRVTRIRKKIKGRRKETIRIKRIKTIRAIKTNKTKIKTQ